MCVVVGVVCGVLVGVVGEGLGGLMALIRVRVA